MTPEQREHVLVIGAGHGGGAVVGFLRQYGWRGRITLVGEEPVAPYQRPPLSKAWLKGEVTLEGLMLKPASFYADQQISLRLGVRAESLDRQAQLVRLSDGSELAYGHLVLATGAGARSLPLPGADWPNVMSLRTLDDAIRIKASLAPGRRVLIIGGGYVGLECAATARALGAEVCVLERTPRLLERVASQALSERLHAVHLQQGVQVVLQAQVEAIEGPGLAEAVRLGDGRRLPCDLILVGVGATPRVELALAAGLHCDDGIVVDADGRSSDPQVLALGDVARRPHALYQRALRLESVPSAQEQARRVAATLTGRAPAPAEVPWFWSDQFDLKLQMAGLPCPGSQTVLRRGPQPDQLAVFHLDEGRVVTVEAINSPQAFLAGKKWIASGRLLDPFELADPARPFTAMSD